MKVKVITGISFILITFLAAAVIAQGHSDIIQVSMDPNMQGWPQVAYDSNLDEYLVVWEDYRNAESDIYGQFVQGDGTLKGTNFPICTVTGDQYWPHLDFDPVLNRYLVVFEDFRNGALRDMYGIFVGNNGLIQNIASSEADGAFPICTNSEDIYTCSVAFNFQERIYLVVWGDYRNDTSSYTGADVYGQRVAADGTLLSPPDTPDPSVNFPIANNVDYEESVADVSYSSITNEWFVAYGTNLGYVLGQRVNHLGKLLKPDGTVVNKPGVWGSAIQVSGQFKNGPDCLQSRVQFNNEYNTTVDSWCECEVVWKGRLQTDHKNDVYGQRIGFFLEGPYYVAKYLDVNGDVSQDVSNHAISIQDGWAGVPDIAFSTYDNEFLVGWGNPADGDWGPQDLYCQRLCVNMNNKDMLWLADDRVNTVANTVNISLDHTSNYEGSLVGIAHSLTRNEFLLVYTFEDYSMSRSCDIYAHRLYGTHPTSVEDLDNLIPTDFMVSQNYPNPFNPESTILFDLPEDGHVTITVFDLMGRKIRTLMDAKQNAGNHSVIWKGKDALGNDVVSGVYFYRVRFGDRVSTSKMTLIR